MLDIENILIVEDDADWLDIYNTELSSKAYQITTARTVKKALRLLAKQEFAAVATDLKLLGATRGGFDILETVRQQSPATQVIIFTGVGGKQDAYEAMRRGAYDYVTKPLDYKHVKQVIKSAIEVRKQKLFYLSQSKQKSQLINLPFPEKFVGSSQAIKTVLKQVVAAIASPKPILIWGEAGTGKALIAETIHLATQQKRFILVNCASFSETMLERRLFGFEKDAFPGALTAEAGALEQASGGTLVLDKVKYLSTHLQKQLLAALSHQRVRRIGSSQTIQVDIRVLATSQVDLNLSLEKKLFSKELYRYLSQTTIELPPLNDRKDEQTDDVLLLTGYFLDKYAQGEGPPLSISDAVKNLLQTYHFPGNVRELEEAIQLAVSQAQAGIIELHHLPNTLQQQKSLKQISSPIRLPINDTIYCPHGYYLSAQAKSISEIFDVKNYAYLLSPPDPPLWYQKTIADVLQALNLKPYPAKDFSSRQDMCQVCHPILVSRLVVIDISEASSFIFYVLGLAQATGVPCLVLKKRGRALSKEVGNLKVGEYFNEESLRASITSVWEKP